MLCVLNLVGPSSSAICVSSIVSSRLARWPSLLSDSMIYVTISWHTIILGILYILLFNSLTVSLVRFVMQLFYIAPKIWKLPCLSLVYRRIFWTPCGGRTSEWHLLTIAVLSLGRHCRCHRHLHARHLPQDHTLRIGMERMLRMRRLLRISTWPFAITGVRRDSASLAVSGTDVITTAAPLFSFMWWRNFSNSCIHPWTSLSLLNRHPVSTTVI